MSETIRRAPAALVIAHPGHEVCVYGWLESARPQVFILTDGSGRVGQSRLSATRQLLSELGLKSGDIFGRFTDRAIYSAVVAQDTELFLSLARELAAAFVRAEIVCVAGDAAEDYNSTHDLCRALINAAVEMAQQMSGREIANYDFPVVGHSYTDPRQLRTDAIWLRLEEDVFQRKIEAAAKYYPELLAEMEGTLNKRRLGPLRSYLDSKTSTEVFTHPLDIFRTECLRPVLPSEWGRELDDKLAQEPPFYEQYGEAQVAAGHYHQVIRYRDHIRPLAQALWQGSQKNQISRGHQA